MLDRYAFIDNIRTLDELERLINNAQNKVGTSEDIDAREVIRRAYDRSWYMLADQNAARDTIEWHLWVALAAYERVLTIKNSNTKKRTYAMKIRQKIKRVGIVKAVSDAVKNGPHSQGYRTLVDMGRLDASFESVVVRFPDQFPDDIVAIAQTSLEKMSTKK